MRCLSTPSAEHCFWFRVRLVPKPKVGNGGRTLELVQLQGFGDRYHLSFLVGNGNELWPELGCRAASTAVG